MVRALGVHIVSSCSINLRTVDDDINIKIKPKTSPTLYTEQRVISKKVIDATMQFVKMGLLHCILTILKPNMGCVRGLEKNT